ARRGHADREKAGGSAARRAKVAGTLRVPSAKEATAHGVCLLLSSVTPDTLRPAVVPAPAPGQTPALPDARSGFPATRALEGEAVRCRSAPSSSPWDGKAATRCPPTPGRRRGRLGHSPSPAAEQAARSGGPR